MKIKQLFEQAEEVFFKYGLKSVTMDDIARRLSMSKKTLYNLVPNKTALIQKVMQNHIEDDMAKLDSLAEGSTNAIEEMLEFGKYVAHKLAHLNPTLLFDLSKSYPQCWKLFEDYTKGYVVDSIKRNLERGIKEDLYRKDLNTFVVATFYSTQMRNISQTMESLSPDVAFKELHYEFLKYHLHGLASEKGLKYLKDKNFA